MFGPARQRLPNLSGQPRRVVPRADSTEKASRAGLPSGFPARRADDSDSALAFAQS